MAEIHTLIGATGQDAARSAASKKLVKAASAILSDEANDIGISYSGFALTALPHRRLPDADPWERRGHRVHLLVEPGRLPVRGGFKLYGVPYGSRARMILLYLQTRAIQTDCREVELGRSMNEWLERMGVSVGGQTYKDIRDQSARLSACRLTFGWEDEHGRLGFEKDQIVSGGVQFLSSTEQPGLWSDTVKLSELFFKELKSHSVPLAETALRQISSCSTAIDVYIWLAYRLHSLDKPRTITWSALAEQFGAGYSRLRDFRKRFIETLQFACAVYPDACVQIRDEGLVLHPSRPPIRKVIGQGR
ncbi:MAG: pirin [Alphaproteobacteria bacterium]|nr:pirin [Alphaproteobacteria bacterium]